MLGARAQRGPSLHAVLCVHRLCVPGAHVLVHLDEDNAIFPSAVVALVLGVDVPHKHLKLVVRLPCPGVVGPRFAHKLKQVACKSPLYQHVVV